MTKWSLSLAGVVLSVVVMAQPPASTDSSQEQNETSNAPVLESPTVIVTNVEELRKTSRDGMSAGMTVTLVIPDYDDTDQVKDVECKLTSAIDEAGRNLVKTEKRFFGNSDFRPDTDGNVLEIEVELKNAARRSTFISLEGTLELFVPADDPASTITVKHAMTTAGKPIESDALKAIKASIVLVTPKENGSSVETGTNDATDEPGGEGTGAALAKGLEEAFSKMFSDGESPNSITLEIDDPEQKIKEIEFFSQRGRIIKQNGTYISHNGGAKIAKTLEFDAPLPETAEMRIYLLTPQSQRKIPFRMSKIALP